MMTKYIRIFSIALLALAGAQLGAQSLTGYFLQGVPQRHTVNPAMQPQCNVYVGVPLLSSVYVENYNNSVTFSDLFWYDDETGELIHPLHPAADVDQFLENFEETNILSSSIMLNLLSFGFRTKSMYFTFEATAKTHEYLTYPGDLMHFALKGNQNGQTFNFSALGVEASEHVEFAVGVSREISDQLTVGIKPKLLKGVANVSSMNNDISLYTTYDEWVFNTQMEIQMSLPGMNYPLDENGAIDLENDFVFDSTINDFQSAKKLVKGNNGFGIDIGAVYSPISQLELSASVIDLGFIKWDNSVHTAKLEGTYTYDGIEIDLSDTAGFSPEIVDSILAGFEFTGSDAPFKTYLTPKVFIGGRFLLTKHFDFGAVARLDFPKTGMKTNITVSANWHPTSMFSLSGSYTPIGGTANTFGLGTSFRLAFLHLYVMTDYFPSSIVMLDGVPVPYQQSNFNVRFGMNFLFGCNKNKQLMKDKPMYYSAEY